MNTRISLAARGYHDTSYGAHPDLVESGEHDTQHSSQPRPPRADVEHPVIRLVDSGSFPVALLYGLCDLGLTVVRSCFGFG